MKHWSISISISSFLASVKASFLAVLVLVLFTAQAFCTGAAATPRVAGRATRALAATSAPSRVTGGTARSDSSTATPPSQGPAATIWLEEPHLITPAYVGARAAASPSSTALARSLDAGLPDQAATSAEILASGRASALSLISADFNGDGVADLAVGYGAPGGGGIVAVHYGSL